MDCSLHSSGHTSSPASSDESENNSHVPFIRLFRSTQAWARLHSLQAHPRLGPELQVHSRVKLNALSAWGLVKLLLCVALALSAPLDTISGIPSGEKAKTPRKPVVSHSGQKQL